MISKHEEDADYADSDEEKRGGDVGRYSVCGWENGLEISTAKIRRGDR